VRGRGAVERVEQDAGFLRQLRLQARIRDFRLVLKLAHADLARREEGNCTNKKREEK